MQDPDDLTSKDDASRDNPRREFLSLLMASGFALAVQPVAASTLATDDAGLTVGAVGIPVGKEILPAYRAQPAKPKGPLPVVLVVQEVFGVHEHIQDLCRRLAKAGYLAIAPELYFRQGDARFYPNISDLLAKLVSKVPDEQVLRDLDATADWTLKNGGDANRIAITGFCWGGRIVWLYAAHNPKLKAAVAWYGRLVGEGAPNTPRHPVDVAGSLKAPVLGLYGGQDKGILSESVDRMRAALKAAGSPSQIVVYPDADHGFNADYRPNYHAAAAKDGWARMLAWFARYGVKP
ncbi:dienelactone hydrolase family protein [Crenobacter cavernae]|uniref:Dienelactone hydrolase family protein n=1 Tax=Crenobacter cavernae TaxID=2290923 RepID=A0ABY0FC44_9NEIS|nr:dienelactone hydrolase family protein [Crenobacter cavernae]RXZ42030.1 dienelactone hydrolase family protein [Crenobacter cavernae]